MAVRKGIVLAGGRGTRLSPLTRVASKTLLPVYDKPMVYYPIALLMLGGVRDLMVITSELWLRQYRRLLGDGSQLGMRIEYAVQAEPLGLPDAFLVGREWIGGEPVAMVLGDNLFYGSLDAFRASLDLETGAHVFAVPTQEPERFGIVEMDDDGMVRSLEEKPSAPRSDLAVPGVYILDGTAGERAAELAPSGRGELEMVDLLESYRKEGALKCTMLGRGFVWLDAGTTDGLLEASNFVATIQKRTGYGIACLEEIAWRQGFIDDDGLHALADAEENPVLGNYLRELRRRS